MFDYHHHHHLGRKSPRSYFHPIARLLLYYCNQHQKTPGTRATHLFSPVYNKTLDITTQRTQTRERTLCTTTLKPMNALPSASIPTTHRKSTRGCKCCRVKQTHTKKRRVEHASHNVAPSILLATAYSWVAYRRTSKQPNVALSQSTCDHPPTHTHTTTIEANELICEQRELPSMPHTPF